MENVSQHAHTTMLKHQIFNIDTYHISNTRDMSRMMIQFLFSFKKFFFTSTAQNLPHFTSISLQKWFIYTFQIAIIH